MKLGLITMVNVPSFNNQAVLIEKVFKENGWEVEKIHTSEALKFPTQRFDKGIALLPLWLRYVNDACRLLAPWFSRSSILYGPVDGPYQMNISFFEILKTLHIVVPSEWCKQCIEKSDIKVLGVVPHGINHEDFKFEDIPKYDRFKRLREKYPNRKILFSNINPLHRKGLPHLVKALQLLHKKIPDKYVFILHTGLVRAQEVINKLCPNEKLLLEKTPNLIIEDQYGRLPFREIALKTVSCDIFVFPSLLEGFGEPILEAAAAQKPIVCVNAPSMNEIVNEKEAWLFPYTHIKEEKWDNGSIAQLHEYEPETLAETMQHAIENEVESQEKAEAAYKKSLDYDYRKVYSKLVAY